MLFEPGNLADQKARIVVVGVGGGGGNALNRMIKDGIKEVEFLPRNISCKCKSCIMCRKILEINATT